MVGSHYDDVPLYPGVRSVRPPPHKVEIWIITEVASPFVAPAIEVATEDPKHDWKFVSWRGIEGSVDGEVETVL